MNKPRHRTPWIVLASALALFAGGVLGAEPYVFEMILFERPSGGLDEFQPADPGEPDRRLARSTLASSALPAAARQLRPVAAALRRRGMILHEHLVWRQVPGRRDSQTWRWLDGVRVQGLVRMTRGRYLHLDTDLMLRDVNAVGGGYRIRLNRRLRSDELHYVDHPRLGIILRATRTNVPVNAPTDADPGAGEPKPAAPAS